METLKQNDMNVKVLRNNYLPVLFWYLYISFAFIAIFGAITDSLNTLSVLAILALLALVILTVLFTRYVIIFITQRYEFYEDKLVIKSKFKETVEILYIDVSNVNKEKSFIKTSTGSIYFYVRINTRTGENYRFGPVKDQDVFIGLLEGDYRVDATKESGLSVVDKLKTEASKSSIVSDGEVFKESRDSFGRVLYLIIFLCLFSIPLLLLLCSTRNIEIVLLVTAPILIIIVLTYFFIAYFFTEYVICDGYLRAKNKVLRIDRQIEYRKIKSAKLAKRINWFRFVNYTVLVECVSLDLGSGKRIKLIPVERTHEFLNAIESKI